MSTETLEDVDGASVEKLWELARVTADGCDGYRDAAERIRDASVANMLRNLALERAAQADELARLLSAGGAGPIRRRSAGAELHRIVIDFRAALNVGDPYKILIEAERGEDQIRELYEVALRETAGGPAKDILRRQHAEVRRSHDRVRHLRDARKSR